MKTDLKVSGEPVPNHPVTHASPLYHFMRCVAREIAKRLKQQQIEVPKEDKTGHLQSE